jgi:hypothetical protein
VLLVDSVLVRSPSAAGEVGGLTAEKSQGPLPSTYLQQQNKTLQGLSSALQQIAVFVWFVLLVMGAG